MKTLINCTTTELKKEQLASSAQTKTIIDNKKLIGVEIVFVDVNSPVEAKKEILNAIGSHFTIKVYPKLHSKSVKAVIAPKEYCLVNGEMMYCTVSFFLRTFTQNGLKFSSIQNIYDSEWNWEYLS